MDKMTPAMRQYYEAKEKHKDALIFFRMGISTNPSGRMQR